MEQGDRSHHACGSRCTRSASCIRSASTASGDQLRGADREQLTQDSVPFEVVSRYRELARGQIIGDSYGVLKLLVCLDTRKLLGVHVSHRRHELVTSGRP